MVTNFFTDSTTLVRSYKVNRQSYDTIGQLLASKEEVRQKVLYRNRATNNQNIACKNKIDMFPQVFQGIRKHNYREVTLEIDESVRLVI